MPFKDPDERRAYGREWMRRNPDKAREAMRRWRQNHADAHAAEGRAFYARNRERVDARNAAYLRANPEVIRTKWRNRRARKVAAGGKINTQEWLFLIERYGGRCGYCGADGPLHQDHRVPLARGGAHSIENIIPACGPCNRRKHTMTDEEFRARLARERGDAA
jgi:5-methylcytosine-specific restriction endonuclease McrA